MAATPMTAPRAPRSTKADATKGQLELDDIQSIIVGAYGRLPAASYLMLTIEDAARARTWAGELSTRVRNAGQGPPNEGPCINVAFTFCGLRRLQLVDQALRGFGAEEAACGFDVGALRVHGRRCGRGLSGRCDRPPDCTRPQTRYCRMLSQGQI